MICREWFLTSNLYRGITLALISWQSSFKSSLYKPRVFQTPWIFHPVSTNGPLQTQVSNTFFFRAPNHSADTQGLLGIIAESLETKAPTRAVCLIPKQENLPHSFLELFTIQASCPLFGYDQSVESVSPCDMSVVLSLNKESMVIDPIQWDSFTSKIRCWSQYWPPDSVSLSQRTCDLFRERVSLSHLPRTLSKQPQNVILKSSSALCFYDAFSSKRPITASATSIPSWAVKLFNKINKHPCFLGVLGILPNQLRRRGATRYQ